MNNEIIIDLEADKPAKVEVKLILPDGSTEYTALTKCGRSWHFYLRPVLTDKAEAWLRAANIIHISDYAVRKLRKQYYLNIPAPTKERMLSFWQEVHTDRKGMHQRFDTPRLANV